MYKEKALKRTIIFMRIRRYIFIFFFVILGLVAAYGVSEFLTEIARVKQDIGNMVMIITAVVIFLIGFILTSALEFKIQQAYLEMKILKRLNIVSYKLTKLLEKEGISLSEDFDNPAALATPKKKKKRLKFDILNKKDKKNNNKKSDEKNNEFIDKLKVDIK